MYSLREHFLRILNYVEINGESSNYIYQGSQLSDYKENKIVESHDSLCSEEIQQFKNGYFFNRKIIPKIRYYKFCEQQKYKMKVIHHHAY